jgi:hypothetical protein
MKKILCFLANFLLFSTFLWSQENKNLNKVDGLELTTPQEVLLNSKNLIIQAKSEGQIKWLVISNKPVKYEEDVTKKQILFKSIDNIENINVFAIANTNGKLSEFANTKITVKPTKEITSSKKSNITLFVNYKTLTPQQNEIINIPYTDTSGTYSDIQFKVLDISNLSEDRLKNYPNGLMIAKNKDKMDVYFGNLPQDVKIFKTILESILNKGN